MQVLQTISKTLTVLLVVVIIFSGLSNVTEAAQWQDGEYSVNYSVLKADSDSASMADGYFVKPAKLIVKDGAIKAQVSINTSAIKEFTVNGTPVKVLSENGESKSVQFATTQLDSPTSAEIHVLIEDMDYDHWYTIRFDFDSSVLKEVSTSSNANETNSSSGESESQSDQNTNSSTASTNANEVKIDNPRTSDESNISSYATLLLVSTIFIVWMLVRKSKAKKIENH